MAINRTNIKLQVTRGNKMKNLKSPSLSDMVRAYDRIKQVGLNNVKLGNCGIFAKNSQDWDLLLEKIGKQGIG